MEIAAERKKLESMSTALLETLARRAETQTPGQSSQPMPTGARLVYAIAFDLDTESLRAHYNIDSYNNAYADIRKILTTEHHFKRHQGSVYFGDPLEVNAVSCVLAIMDVARTFPWFEPSVRDVRMLRIEEQNDLMDAVRSAVK